jgi:hypothetical protein
MAPSVSGAPSSQFFFSLGTPERKDISNQAAVLSGTKEEDKPRNRGN